MSPLGDGARYDGKTEKDYGNVRNECFCVANEKLFLFPYKLHEEKKTATDKMRGKLATIISVNKGCGTYQLNK